MSQTIFFAVAERIQNYGAVLPGYCIGRILGLRLPSSSEDFGLSPPLSATELLGLKHFSFVKQFVAFGLVLWTANWAGSML